MPDRFTRPGPKHLRSKGNSAGAGTFTDDTDWAGTNTAIPSADRAPLALRRLDGAGAVQKFMVMYAAFDTNGGRLNRGSMTCSVQPHGQFRRPEEPPDSPAPGHEYLQWDGVSVDAIPPNRWVIVEMPGELEAFSIRLHTFAGIIGTATQLRVYYREI